MQRIMLRRGGRVLHFGSPGSPGRRALKYEHAGRKSAANHAELLVPAFDRLYTRPPNEPARMEFGRARRFG